MADEPRRAPGTHDAASRRTERTKRAYQPYGAPSSEALALLIGVGVALLVMVALIAYLWT